MIECTESYLNNLHFRSMYMDGYRQALLDLLQILNGDMAYYIKAKKHHIKVIQDVLKQREYFVDGNKQHYIQTKKNEKTGKNEFVGIVHSEYRKDALREVIHIALSGKLKD